jgi:hypothetical protein
MIFTELKSRISWHFILECVFIFAVIAKEDILVDIQHAVFDVLLSKCSEELSIEIVSNSTTIKHLANHVLKHSSVDLLNLILLRICAHKIVEILFNEAEGSFQI